MSVMSAQRATIVLLTLVTALPALAAEDPGTEPASPLAHFDFLAGHTWRSAQARSDGSGEPYHVETSYSWDLEGRLLRGRSEKVFPDGRRVQAAQSVKVWDPMRRLVLEYVWGADGWIVEGRWFDLGTRLQLRCDVYFPDGSYKLFKDDMTRLDDDRFHWLGRYMEDDGSWSVHLDDTMLKKPDPRAILEEAAEASRATRRVHYRFNYEGEGTMAGAFTGETWLLERSGVTGSAIKVRLRSAERSPTSENLTLATDGQHIVTIDHIQRTMTEGSSTQGGSQLFTKALYGVLLELISDTPFRADLAEASLEWAGVEMVDGIPCDIVRVRQTGPDDLSTVDWLIARDDRLPRGQRWSREAAPAGSFTYTLTNLDADPDLPEALFRPSRPEGYTMQDARKGGISAGAPAPPWILHASDGGTVSLENLRGKYTVMLFWASWCAVCHELLPDFDRASRLLDSEETAFIGISTWEVNDDAARRRVRELDANFTHLLAGERIAADYDVTTLPGLFVIDPEGRFAQVEIGPTFANPIALADHLRFLLHQ